MFVDVASGIKRGGVSVIPWQVLKMFKNRATHIAQGELFAPFLAILTNLKDAIGQHLLVFCDNLGILSAAVLGRSSVLDMNSLLTGLHLLLTSLRVTSWWEHVDTHANPADGGSRQGMSCKLAKRLGIPLEWVKFLFVPACMAAAGPTEWLKFFKMIFFRGTMALPPIPPERLYAVMADGSNPLTYGEMAVKRDRIAHFLDAAFAQRRCGWRCLREELR